MKRVFKKFLVFAGVLAAVAAVLVPALAVPVSAQATNFSLNGYRVTVGGGGAYSAGWTGGNLGNQWAEGEWVPYKLVITNVQTNYPGLANFPDIVLSFDFHDANGMFVDLIRGIQVGTTDLTDLQGFPTSGGGPQANNIAGAQLGQNDPDEWAWTNFALLNLPNEQVNRSLVPLGDLDVAPGTDKHVFIIHPSDILGKGGVTVDSNTIVIYYQAHLSRTFVWSNALQDFYATDADLAKWGGYLYATDAWPTSVQNGSGYQPGSSGHMHLEVEGTGQQDVPIPIPPKPVGLIDGYKFEDRDADHIWDPGEPAIPGWDIHMYSVLEGGIVIDVHETTDANGFYSFPNLTEGIWYIGEHVGPGDPPLAGWTQTFPYNVGNVPPGANSSLIDNFPNNIKAAIGPAHLAEWGWIVSLTDAAPMQHNVNFGNVSFATKTGTKFHDLNANGVWDNGEPGLGGWTIYVDYNNNGVFDAATEPSAVTAGDGTYSINNVAPGTWRVREVLQAGWFASYPATSDAFGRYHEETFVGGQTYSGNDFGNWTTASKSGMKFEDMNADGDKDAEDTGLAGWVIYVDYNDNGVKDANEPFATTAADGTYTITGINPGTWKVKEVAQAGWTQSYPVSGYHEETFTSGAALTGNDFGNWTTAEKSGYKFNDKYDADGVRDADGVDNILGNADDEVLLSGWTIRIYEDTNGNGLLDQAEYDAGPLFTDVTDVNGAYSFTVNPGKYIVVEVMQDKLGTPYYQSYPATPVLAGGLNTGTELLGANGHAVTLVSSQIDNNNHFGNYWPHTTMTLFDFVWETTADGNVTLTISDTNDGDVNLTDAHVHLLANDVEYPFSPISTPTSGDDGDGIFEPGETWTWIVYVTITQDTTFSTWGHGEDPFGNTVDYPQYQSEYAEVFVEVNEATRTQGFWSTHLDFTEMIFDNYTGDEVDNDNVGFIDLGWRQITNINDLMGVFWANNAKNSDGSNRSALCQARIIASNQALAALLNAAMPGGAPLPAGYSPAEIAAILGGTDIPAIKMLGSVLGAYNEDGDDVALDPILGSTGKANPQQAKALANIGFADCNIQTSLVVAALPASVVKNTPVNITFTLNTVNDVGAAGGTFTVIASKDSKFPNGANKTITVGSGAVNDMPFNGGVSFTPTSAGTWYIKITYSGDGENYGGCSVIVTLVVTNS
ncbi:hypothetical protein DEALK_18100 [Dehalogenimonas alkenigignens]|uniref:SD-repeat containing protein B domain-containing protein n=1 Tax=Dehalogenimonas alkenigignens TaxID=1217799 RepID=A0A0W0GKB7_9CHLR|nr:hypothetical protein [Dehalogenimonas alkenigignens]KTB48963.1 hypothetical protein DEALK_18100 [Dehalogenimonas alkenigignens]